MPAIWEVRSDGSYETHAGKLRIIIHKHLSNPDKWHVTCPDLGVARKELRADSDDLAKAEGVAYLKRFAQVCAEWLNSLD